MGSDAISQAPSATLPSMTFSPIEPKNDAILFLRRDSVSSRGSSHNSSATPTNTSPPPPANPRFNPVLQHGLSSNSPPLTPVPNNLLQPVDEEPPNTPSSTVVEFGDLMRSNVPSAAELVETIHRSYSESHVSRSESRPRGKTSGNQEGRDARKQNQNRGTTAVAPREESQPAHARSATPRDHIIKAAEREREATTEKGMADERINRFLTSMAQQAAQDAESELVQENKSLYQRIAALQRTERELLAENQEVTRKFRELKHHHDRRARQWSEGLRRKESEDEARIQEMSEQLLDLTSTHPNKLPTILSNEKISTWFDDQDASWNSWSRTFGHLDPKRLSNGLHPLQLKELCDEVKGYVRITEEGNLPPQLLEGGKEALHTLLNAMLANFICAEILASPLWVFQATSLGTLESPGTAFAKPFSGLPSVGIRMDMNAFSDVAPARPGPCPTPRSPQFPPPLITSMMPALGSSTSFLGLPLKADMERLVHMLRDAQGEDAKVTAHHWRAQMMRLLADGGFSLKDVAAAGRNESRRSFVESRLNYARKLKECFLSSAARYLLSDQDSGGIENLERTLTGLVDDALRFSCTLWTRLVPVRLHGWTELGGKEFRCSSQLATLCHAQSSADVSSPRSDKCKDKHTVSQTRDEGERLVIMVVQPAVVTDNSDFQGLTNESSGDSVALVWLRARVMVAGLTAADPDDDIPAGVGSQPSLRLDVLAGKAGGGGSANSSITSPKVDTPKAFVLPASLYNINSMAGSAEQRTA